MEKTVVKKRYLRMLRDLCRVLSMVTMSASLLTGKLVLEKLLQSKVMMNILVLCLEELLSSFLLWVRCLTLLLSLATLETIVFWNFSNFFMFFGKKQVFFFQLIDKSLNDLLVSATLFNQVPERVNLVLQFLYPGLVVLFIILPNATLGLYLWWHTSVGSCAKSLTKSFQHILETSLATFKFVNVFLLFLGF